MRARRSWIHGDRGDHRHPRAARIARCRFDRRRARIYPEGEV